MTLLPHTFGETSANGGVSCGLDTCNSVSERMSGRGQGRRINRRAAHSKPELPLRCPLSAKALMALFNLKYPIFEAPHGNATSPELAQAVSNAGAIGALSLTSRTPDVARMSVSQIRAGTKGPFLVNYILTQEPTTLQIALDAGAPIVQFSWGMPTREMVSAIRAAGARFGVQVTSAESARTALDLGAGYLACQGTEVGGHVQANRGLYEALPNVLKEAREIPVLACGGIGNGEGIYKALVAGASGAMLGTRFVATIESNAHPAYQRALMAAHADDTVLTTCFEGGWPNALTAHCGIEPSSRGMRPDVRQRASGLAKAMFWNWLP